MSFGRDKVKLKTPAFDMLDYMKQAIKEYQDSKDNRINDNRNASSVETELTDFLIRHASVIESMDAESIEALKIKLKKCFKTKSGFTLNFGSTMPPPRYIGLNHRLLKALDADLTRTREHALRPKK